jgi:hypothetical protein
MGTLLHHLPRIASKVNMQQMFCCCINGLLHCISLIKNKGL